MLKSLRPLFPYMKRYRWGYVLGTLSVFLHNGIWILFPQVIRRAVDDLQAGVTSTNYSFTLCCCWRWPQPRESFSS